MKQVASRVKKWTSPRLAPLKRALPYTVFGRFFLMIVAPMVLMQMVATYMFYERHWSNVSQHMSMALAGEVAMIVFSVKEAPPKVREQFLENARRHLYLQSFFYRREELQETRSTNDPTLSHFANALAIRIPLPFTVYFSRDGDSVFVDVQLQDGLLRIIASKKRLANPTTYIFIMWMIGTSLLLLFVSVLFLKNQVRSIRQLAEAAEQFGKGLDVVSFKPTGALEVRKAAHAFLRMKERIERQITQRTEMLAGVSHDLRTPLTRLKLQLALLGGNAEHKAMQEDIHEMEKMIQAYLDFCRGEGTETPKEAYLSVMIAGIITPYKHSNTCTIRFVPPSRETIVSIRGHAFKRAMVNLIENAIRYSKVLEISLVQNQDSVTILLDDDGPGIPEAQREAVFRPFYRMDHSRNLSTGGVGLGLAITRDIITGHGGTIQLQESPLGGLRVRITLPC